MRAIYALVAATLMTLAFTGTLNAGDRAGAGGASPASVRPSDMGLRGALIADTMPPASLTAAMGIARTTSDTARIFGALTGAGLFAAIGIGPSYVAITVFYALGAILTWNTVAPGSALAEEIAAAEAAEQKPSPWRELWEGVAAGLEHAAAAGHRLVRVPVQLRGVSADQRTDALRRQGNLRHRPDRARLPDRQRGGRRIRRLHHHDAFGHDGWSWPAS